jgi:WD40 repeat protein
MLAAANVRNVCIYSMLGGFPAIVPRGQWCFHFQRVGCLAWSPDGTVLASSGGDDSIFLWCPGAVPLCAQGRDHGVGVCWERREFVLLLLCDCPSLSFFPFVGRRQRWGWGGDWTLVSAGADGQEKFGL